MNRFLLSLALLLGTLGPVSAQIAASGVGSGSLLVDGKPIPLKYVYAVQVDNVETTGLVISDPAKFLVLVLSDRPLPRVSVANRDAPFSDRRSPGQIMEPLEKTVADKMYGVMLKYDLEKKALFQAQFLYPDAGIGFSIVGAEIPDRITGLKMAKGEVSGTASLPSRKETGREKPPKTYQYRIAFRAPLRSEPPVTAKWEDKAALESPPVLALREYLKAAREGDVEALRRLTARSHQPFLKNPEVLKFLKAADTTKMEEHVKRVVVRGDTASVILVNKEPSYSEVRMQLLREPDGWRLCWP